MNFYKYAVILVAVFMRVDSVSGQVVLGVKLENISESIKVEVPNQSELEKFASWFHQDWKFVFDDFYKGTDMYLNNISKERVLVLKDELRLFIEINKNSSSIEMKNAWLKLGAQGWQEHLDIRQSLNDFLEVMNRNE